MVESALRWPMMGGTYLKVIGCLGATLVDLLGGVTDFNTADGFGFGDWVDFGARECEGLRGSRGAERTDRFNRSFPVMRHLILFWGIGNFLAHAMFQF